MEKKYLLPPLKNVVQPGSDDCWEERNDAYDFLIQNLELDYEPVESVFEGGSNTIPHIFEQMLIFNRAFFDEYDPDHNRAVLEWRAVMAIMALKKIKNINLDVVKINLSGNSRNPFLVAASQFKPEDEPVVYNTTWDFLYVLIIENEPIAIFSPITIVVPAKHFRKKIEKVEDQLKWLTIEKRNGVEEIIFEFGDKGNEYIAIRNWMQKLRVETKMFQSNKIREMSRFERIQSELKKFIQICDSCASGEILNGEENAQRQNALFQTGIYQEMNNELRREYSFLNYCCDFQIADKRLEFLIGKYKDDIFENRITLITYDDSPESIYKKEHLRQLKKILPNVMSINGENSMMSVTEAGKEEIPFMALLPFKRELIDELMERDIPAEDLLEEYSLIYDKNRKTIKVRLEFKNFTYTFDKTYAEEDCTFIDSNKLPAIYIWPGVRLKTTEWNSYYAYVGQCEKETVIEIPNAERVKYETGSSNLKEREFQIIKSKVFPSYIYLNIDGIGGFLPVKVQSVPVCDAGGTAEIFVDIGHASTYITMIKSVGEESGRSYERIKFVRPKSTPVITHNKQEELVSLRFISPEDIKAKEAGTYFKNILHNFYKYDKKPSNYSVEPVVDGQMLFCYNAESEKVADAMLYFISFEYGDYYEENRRSAHIFLEQLILYSVYSALLAQCTYVEVHFVYSTQEQKLLGELLGLWEHALERVKERTGIRRKYGRSISCISEQEALAYRLLQHMIEKRIVDGSVQNINEDQILVGMDIGWKKTIVTRIYSGDKEEGLNAQSAQLAFGGKDISFLDKEKVFKIYDNVLNILLGGSFVIDDSTDSYNRQILSELKELYDSCPKGEEYYYGLFDVIAMKIEKNHFVLPPDVFHNTNEFNVFIRMLTYNIFLLFLEVGSVLGKMLKVSKSSSNSSKKHIHILLGGNGAKFIYWISNLKNANKITEENSGEWFVIGMEKSILKIIADGIRVIAGNNDMEIECEISLLKDGKEQMVEGYVFKKMARMYNYERSVPEFKMETIEDEISDSSEAAFFYNHIDEIRSSILGEIDESLKTSGGTISGNGKKYKMSEMIKTDSCNACKTIILEVDKM